MSVANQFLQLLRGTVPARPGPSDEVRLWADPDGALWTILADGTTAQVGGGGSMPIQALTKNGLVKDYDLGDLSGNNVVFLDPRAQPWLPNHVYSMESPGSNGGVRAWVTPTDDPTVKFGTCYAMHGDSGADEPTWPGNGSVDDNEISWGAYGFDPAGWQALTTYDGSKRILANGSLWSNDGAGDSGAVEPDWSTAPNGFDTVMDGDLTWMNEGPAATWEADTTYSFYALPDGTNYFNDYVIPSTPGDQAYGIIVILKGFVASGADEPDWHSATPGSSLYATDGEILWEETEEPESLVITGIVAPSDPALLTLASAVPPGDPQVIKLEDEASVVGDYGTYAESSVGNRFSNPDSATPEVDASHQLAVAYLNDQWQTLDAVS